MRLARSASMRTGNRGQVLVIVALAFAVFLGFAALAVDVAYLYTVRNELQRCADAGALAGASAFVDNSIAVVDLLATADQRARTLASPAAAAGSPLRTRTEENVGACLA